MPSTYSALLSASPFSYSLRVFVVGVCECQLFREIHRQLSQLRSYGRAQAARKGNAEGGSCHIWRPKRYGELTSSRGNISTSCGEARIWPARLEEFRGLCELRMAKLADANLLAMNQVSMLYCIREWQLCRRFRARVRPERGRGGV